MNDVTLLTWEGILIQSRVVTGVPSDLLKLFFTPAYWIHYITSQFKTLQIAHFGWAASSGSV